MSYTKKNLVTNLIKINKLFEKNIIEDNLNEILDKIFTDELTIYKKKVLNNIINSILYKRNINENEQQIILKIIEAIKYKITENKNNSILWDSVIINIINTIYLRKIKDGDLKKNIIEGISKDFPEMQSYINFCSLESILKVENNSVPQLASNQYNFSQIKVYVYKVFHGKETNKKNCSEKYSFSKGIKKINNSEYIKSNQNGIYTIDDSKIYSRDIIESRNNANDSNTINSLFTVNSNIGKLYDLYKKMSSRLVLNNFKIQPNSKSILYDNINSLIIQSINIMEEYFIENCEEKPENMKDDGEIIYNIEENPITKIIVMGDQHGSLHSFFRIFIRLLINKIIGQDFKLKEGYKIIFLGDIIDRGYFGIEIMYIILKLITVNNSGHNLSSLNVILNRGNHEEQNQFQTDGFSSEITKKFPSNSNKIIKSFVLLYKYCPSAIILKHKGTNYWLCHGGFNIKDESEKIIIENNKCIYRDIENNVSQIRWNDFVNNDDNSKSTRNLEGGNIFNIGTVTLNNFLKTNKINFIIRGHTDNLSNAMLLYKDVNNQNGEEWFILNKTYFKETIYYQYLNNTSILNYQNINTKKKCNEEIVIINPKILFDFKFLSSDYILYPILTISNNSDNGRYQYDDSYIVIE